MSDILNLKVTLTTTFPSFESNVYSDTFNMPVFSHSNLLAVCFFRSDPPFIVHIIISSVLQNTQWLIDTNVYFGKCHWKMYCPILILDISKWLSLPQWIYTNGSRRPKLGFSVLRDDIFGGSLVQIFKRLLRAIAG